MVEVVVGEDVELQDTLGISSSIGHEWFALAPSVEEHCVLREGIWEAVLTYISKDMVCLP